MNRLPARLRTACLSLGLALLGLPATAPFAARPAHAQEAPATCAFDPDFTPVAGFAELVGPEDAVKGAAEADVVVIEYFDPNCPHCRMFYPVMNDLAATYGDRVRFVYKPVVALGQMSVAPVAALHAAVKAGKFFPMLDQMFATAKRGYSLADLRGYAGAVGMDPFALEADIRGNVYTPRMQHQRDEFDRLAFPSVPAVLIDGRLVPTAARTPECLGELIESRLAE